MILERLIIIYREVIILLNIKLSLGKRMLVQLSREFPAIAHNGKRLCAGGDLKNESSKLVQKPIRITAVDVSTSAPIAQNRC